MIFQTLSVPDNVYTEASDNGFSNALLTSVYFRAETDRHDTPVSCKKSYVFRHSLDKTEGHVFFLSFPVSGKSIVYIVPTPDHVTPALSIHKGELRIECGGYPIVRGECLIGEETKLCRNWYRTLYHPQQLVTMSNTWGDRGGREVVTEEFVRGEIDLAKELGVDVVQVDDGWQKQAPNTYDEDGKRVFEGDFWDVQESVFPNGIESITPYAKERGVETGLWFAPHSRKDFEHFERDIAILKRAYEDWGFRYFKLDMLQLYTKSQCERADAFIREILSFGEDATVELDVTADQRLGYLASAPFGTLFVENRYSAWENYYPHATLRNLWKLAEYIPASKLQFELVNPERFAEAYREEDVLRPSLYSIDYLFASVMVSNPLLWMEMQHLSAENRKRLRNIITEWKQYRQELLAADVRPIGEEPSGASLTGFIADSEDALHVILLREVSDRDTFSLDLGAGYDAPVLVASNTKTTVTLENGKLTATLEDRRSFVWLRLQKAKKA